MASSRSACRMRLVFMATGDIALPTFRYLLEHGPRPVALVTQPDKPVGRHQRLTPPAIKLAALAAGIPVLQPEKVGDAAAELAAYAPEVIVVMAYGQMLRKSILTLASKAIINLHASLLPKYRGAACIQAAIDAGEEVSGVTAMHVVRELDAGAIIVSRAIPIAPDETGGSLHDRLAELAPEVLAQTLHRFAAGEWAGTPQEEARSSYVSKLEREHGRIDWTRDAAAIERRIRAYDPWPGTYTILHGQGRLKRVKLFPPTQVLERRLPAGSVAAEDGRLVIGCGAGALAIEELQPEGARRMSAAEFLRGHVPERAE